jgi:hypothetical protein
VKIIVGIRSISPNASLLYPFQHLFPGKARLSHQQQNGMEWDGSFVTALLVPVVISITTPALGVVKVANHTHEFINPSTPISPTPPSHPMV